MEHLCRGAICAAGLGVHRGELAAGGRPRAEGILIGRWAGLVAAGSRLSASAGARSGSERSSPNPRVGDDVRRAEVWVDLPLGGPRVRIVPVEVEGGCPACGVASSRVHGLTEQLVRDVLHAGRVVVVAQKPRLVCVPSRPVVGARSRLQLSRCRSWGRCTEASRLLCRFHTGCTSGLRAA
jgi:zinc-finger of transposase IS204/IS1001/IS1096/IS1165